MTAACWGLAAACTARLSNDQQHLDIRTITMGISLLILL